MQWRGFRAFVIITAAAAVCVSILLPLQKAQTTSSTHVTASTLVLVGDRWQNTLVSRIQTVIAITNAASGFVVGAMKVLPNISAPASERIAGQLFSRFDAFAQLLAATQPMMQSLQLQPGGAISQTFPANRSIGFDIRSARPCSCVQLVHAVSELVVMVG